MGSRGGAATGPVPDSSGGLGKTHVKPDHKLQVTAVESGTVIDHLRAGTALRTLRLLDLDEHTTVFTGTNLPSTQQGRKDLIKVEGLELTPEQINKVALLSPAATLSIIRDYKIVQKTHPQIPDEIVGILRCVNPACVTQDPLVSTHFTTECRSPVRLRCRYCERTFPQAEFDFL